MSETQMEKCCECLVNMFHQYSVRVDHFDMLSKSELKQMIQQQVPNYMKKVKDPKFFDQLFEELDKDKNKQLDFGEFMVLMARILIAVHEHIHQRGGHSH